MKKTVSIIVLLILVISFSFASSPFSFNGSGTILGANIKKTGYRIDDNGIVIKTDNEVVVAESDDLSVRVESNSLLGIIVNGDDTTVYLIYGEAAVTNYSASKVKLYTTTTLIETGNQGDFYLISTDTEEKVINLTSSEVKAYDGVRGKFVLVPSLYLHDYFGDETYPQNGEGKVSTPLIPATPVFVNTSIVLSVPNMPSFSESEALLETPDAPTFTTTSTGNN